MGTETYSRTTSTSGTGGAGGTSGALGQEGERSENGQSIAHSSDGASPHMAHGGRVPPVGGALLCRDPSRGTERPQPRSGQCSGGEVGPGGRGWGSPRAEQHLRSHRDLHFCQQDRRGRGHRGHREHQGGRQGPSHHGHPERRRRRRRKSAALRGPATVAPARAASAPCQLGAASRFPFRCRSCRSGICIALHRVPQSWSGAAATASPFTHGSDGCRSGGCACAGRESRVSGAVSLWKSSAELNLIETDAL